MVNLSAWEAQADFEAFLIDYLCSSVGYEVRDRSVANAFIRSRRYNLILDGLDEIPARLRNRFSERLDEFVQGLPSEVGVVVTCRAHEYEALLADYRTGLGLVQAVEILPLTSEQLDTALAELAKFDDKDWELFLSQRHLKTGQQARDVLSNPLFLNLVVVGHLRPRQLLECDSEQEGRNLVIDGYLNRTLANQRQYNPEDARRYLTWIARFLNGAEVSSFGLKTSDLTVFDLADLTPPEPPRRYRFFPGLLFGLLFGLTVGLALEPATGLSVGLGLGLPYWLSKGEWSEGSAVSFLEGLGFWLVMVLVMVPTLWLLARLGSRQLESRPLLITSRTPKEALSRSLIAALPWLVGGPVLGLSVGLGLGLGGPALGLFFGLGVGLFFGLQNGGWFVLLQKIAHRHLRRTGKLPKSPADFLEWGIEQQIFRRVGGKVRFRHDLIQQHLADTSEGTA